MTSRTTSPTDTLASRSALLREEGRRRFAFWNAELFDAYVTGPATALSDHMHKQADEPDVVAGYLQLVQEGIGGACLRQAKSAALGWTNFLEFCLVQAVPALLPQTGVGKRLPLLVKIWNLGEGLLREPSWLDRYVTARAGELADLAEIESFLVHTLEPVLKPVASATWTGPFAVTVHDLRPIHDEFLPGTLRLAAPTVVCVTDRRKPGLEVGMLLQPGRKSELLGVTTGLGAYDERGALPPIHFQDGHVTINKTDVPLPFLRRCRAHVTARNGFVVACAADSQCLWIVESP
jgi:hypothetical protein